MNRTETAELIEMPFGARTCLSCLSVSRTSSLTYCRPQLSSLGLVVRSTCLCPPVSQPSLNPMESRPFTPYLSGHLSCEQADGPEQTGMGSGILVLGGSRAGGALLRGGSFAGNQIRMTAKTDAVAAVGVRPAAMRPFVRLLWPLVTIVTPHDHILAGVPDPP